MSILPAKSCRMMNKKIFFVALLICITTLFIQQCSLNQISGGTGAETGNAKIAGIIVDTNGTPAANVTVWLYPAQYNPVTDTPPQFPFVDTTNTSGEYCFNIADTGNFTIIAKNTVTTENVFVKEVIVNHQDIQIATGTLRKTGSIRINFTPDMKFTNGYVFIRGTSLSTFVKNSDLAAGYVLIDSVPEGEIPLYTIHR
jgi:hypothetical protein